MDDVMLNNINMVPESPRPNQWLTMAIAAAVGIVAVTLKFLTGGWIFFFLGILFVPAILLAHVGTHAWSCDALNVPASRRVRIASNIAFVVAMLAQVDYGDNCGWYAFTALLSAPLFLPEAGACMRTDLPLFGLYHNLIVLVPLLGSWLVLIAFPRAQHAEQAGAS